MRGTAVPPRSGGRWSAHARETLRSVHPSEARGRVTSLILVWALLGCGSAETKDDPKTPVVAVPQDTPPPAEATAEAPDFADPKPPAPVSSRASKEVESMRDRLLHDDGR